MSQVIEIQKLGLATGIQDDIFRLSLVQSLNLASRYSREQRQSDGLWSKNVRRDAISTARYIFLHHALDFNFTEDKEELVSWLLSLQNPDGSWGIHPQHPGDLSVTVEVYLALKLLSVPSESPRMRSARGYIMVAGGIANVRLVTRIYLAMFGICPWVSVPEMPPEMILAPSILSVMGCKWPIWEEDNIVPFLIISHHRPVYNNRKFGKYLDDLGYNPADEVVPHAGGAGGLLYFGRPGFIALALALIENFLCCLGGLRLFNLLRRYAIQKCIDWIYEYHKKTEENGDTASPLHGTILALSLEGHRLHSELFRRELEPAEGYTWPHQRERHRKNSLAFRDTSLMVIGLMDAEPGANSSWLVPSLTWLHGQLQRSCGNLETARFCSGCSTTSYPGVSSIAAAIVATVRKDPLLLNSFPTVSALKWLLAMQNRDGGWGELSCDKNGCLFFRDIDLCDPEGLRLLSTPDASGHVLEAFGLVLEISRQFSPRSEYFGLLDRLALASQKAIYHLSAMQEPCGAWYGHWYCNYTYGTYAVLSGLAYFVGIRGSSGWSEKDDAIYDNVLQAVDWLQASQHDDGSWGETLHACRHCLRADLTISSQTAWALMGLLPYLPRSAQVMRKGVEYLLRTQTKIGAKGATWLEEQYASHSHPFVSHSFSSHYYPTMALARFANASEQSPLSGNDP